MCRRCLAELRPLFEDLEHGACANWTLAELTVGPLIASSSRERIARQAHLQQAEADFDPLPFDAQAARALGRVAASLRRSGHKRSARSYDAMIAAIAIANNLPLYTCNPADFAGINGLVVVPVLVPAARLPRFEGWRDLRQGRRKGGEAVPGSTGRMARQLSEVILSHVSDVSAFVGAPLYWHNAHGDRPRRASAQRAGRT